MYTIQYIRTMHKSIQKIPLPILYKCFIRRKININYVWLIRFRLNTVLTDLHGIGCTLARVFVVRIVTYSFKNIDGRWISGPRGNFDRNKFQIIPRKTINNTIIDMCDCTITRALRSMKCLRLY